jgi:hypothetical protein
MLVTAEAGVATTGDKINMAADVAVTLSAGTTTATLLKGIEDATTGFVDAALITALTAGSVADVKEMLVTAEAGVATTGDKINMAADVAVTLSDVGNTTDTDAILNATTGAVTTGQLIAGTYANFATGDKIATGLTFSAHTSTVSAGDSNLTWAFSAGTLTYESVDAGTATNVALVLTGVTAVAEANGIFTLTV